jgi:hypothetical protein
MQIRKRLSDIALQRSYLKMMHLHIEVEGMVVEEEGGAKLVVRCGCVCVYVLLAFNVKAGGSALILMNNGVVPVLT